MSRLSRALPPADYTTDEASFHRQLEGRRRVSPAICVKQTNRMQAHVVILWRPNHISISNQCALTEGAAYPIASSTAPGLVRTGPPRLTRLLRRFVSTVASPASCCCRQSPLRCHEQNTQTRTGSMKNRGCHAHSVRGRFELSTHRVNGQSTPSSVRTASYSARTSNNRESACSSTRGGPRRSQCTGQRGRTPAPASITRGLSV